MSRAYQCDRCGSLFEFRCDERGNDMTGEEICISVRHNGYSLDLCNSCQKKLLEFLLEAEETMNVDVRPKVKRQFNNLIDICSEDIKKEVPDDNS